MGCGGVWRERTRKGRGERDVWGEGDGEKRSGGDEDCRGVKYNGGKKADTTLPGFDFLISTSCDIHHGDIFTVKIILTLT